MLDIESQQRIIDEAKEFSEKEIRPFAGDFEKNEAIPKHLIKKLANKGYLLSTLPKEYGGLDLDPLYYGFLTEEIGKGCCSTRSLLTVQSSLVAEIIYLRGTKEQKEKWLPLMGSGDKIGAFCLTEPNIGTDARSIETNYEKSGNNYIINGKKKWISFGDIADFYIVVASNGNKVSAFIVERNNGGVTSTPMKGLLAGKAAHIAEIDFCNAEVPEENVLGGIGNGFSFIVNNALDHGRYSIAWAGVAIAQAALEEMVTYARKREQFGKKLHNFQIIKGIIADAATEIHAARSLCINAGTSRRDKKEDATILTTMAKYFSSKVAMKVTIDAIQVHGGNGCYNKYPVERLFREAKILEIIEGTSQIQQELISHYSLKKYFRR